MAYSTSRPDGCDQPDQGAAGILAGLLDTGERATRWRGHPISTHTHRLARRRIGSKTSPARPRRRTWGTPAGTSPSFCGRGKDACYRELPPSTSESTVCIDTVPPVSLSPIWALTSPVPPMTTLESS